MEHSTVVIGVLVVVILGMTVVYAIGAPWYRKVCGSGSAPDGMPCGIWKPKPEEEKKEEKKAGYLNRSYYR